MNKRHRIFIAINLPEEIKNELVKRQNELKNKFTLSQDEYSNQWVRWTKKENLHITLEFLGYLTDQELAEVCLIVKEVANKHTCFSLNIKKILYGPPKIMPPRMIWATGERCEEFNLLCDRLAEALAASPKIHFKPENRENIPHITLARINQWEWRRIEPDERPEIEEDINLSFEVKSIEVMESQLRRAGSEYKTLESYFLKKLT